MWNEFPDDDNPYARWKYVSFSIARSLDKAYYYRRTDGVLDWLAQVGGLIRAFLTIG